MDDLIARLLEAAEGFVACRDEENAFLTSEAAAALRAAAEREQELTQALGECHKNLASAAWREKELTEALAPFAQEGDIPDGAIPDDASLIYLTAAKRIKAHHLKHARTVLAKHEKPAPG